MGLPRCEKEPKKCTDTTTERISQAVSAHPCSLGSLAGTCHAEPGGQGHPWLSPAVLEALLQGSLDEGPTAAAVPDRQLQAPHALQDLLLLLGVQEPSRVRHVRHERHVDVHGLPVHQRRQNPLQRSKGEWHKGFGVVNRKQVGFMSKNIPESRRLTR